MPAMFSVLSPEFEVETLYLTAGIIIFDTHVPRAFQKYTTYMVFKAVQLFKKSAIWFSKNGGGSKAVWNFSENSSVLVASPVPNRSWCLFCCASVRVTSSHNSFSHRTVKLTWAQIVGRLRAGIETEQDNRGQLSYQIWGPITRIVPSQTKRINNQARNYSLQ